MWVGLGSGYSLVGWVGHGFNIILSIGLGWIRVGILQLETKPMQPFLRQLLHIFSWRGALYPHHSQVNVVEATIYVRSVSFACVLIKCDRPGCSSHLNFLICSFVLLFSWSKKIMTRFLTSWTFSGSLYHLARNSSVICFLSTSKSSALILSSQSLTGLKKLSILLAPLKLTAVTKEASVFF